MRELARGGMGVVYVARHPQLDREVALKLLLSAAPGQALARFQAEAEALARVSHPGIVRVFDYGHDGRAPYLVMELVDGEALDDVLKRDGALPARRAAEVTAALADAIEAAHRAGVLHRDLKPANVLLDRAGQPRVTDFGISKDDQRQSLTQSGQVLGTPAFMAPEQAEGDKARMGPTADVYGLGATLYALLCGHPPFRGASAMNVLVAVMHKPHVPLPESVDPALTAIVNRCLEKEPPARFPSAAALAEALRAYLEGDAPVAPPPRRQTLGLALATVGLVLAAGLGALAFRETPPPPPEQPDPTPPAPPDPGPAPPEVVLAKLGVEARYRAAWELLQREPPVSDALRAEAQAVRDRFWLRVPLARRVFETQDTNDAVGSFVPGDPGLIFVQATGYEQVARWRWQDPQAEPTVQDVPGETLRDAVFLPNPTTLWLIRNGNRTDPGPVLELAQGIREQGAIEATPVAEQATGRMRTCALSPDAALLVAGGQDTPPRLYDARSGALLRFLTPALESLEGVQTRYLAFSPDGRWVLGTAEQESRDGADPTGLLQVWDAASGEQLYTQHLPLKPNRPFASRNGALIGVGHLGGATFVRVRGSSLGRGPQIHFKEPHLSGRDGLFLYDDTYVLLSGGLVEEPKDVARLDLWSLDGDSPTRVRSLYDGGVPGSDACRGRLLLSADRRFLIVSSLKDLVEVYEGDRDPPSREALLGE